MVPLQAALWLAFRSIARCASSIHTKLLLDDLQYLLLVELLGQPLDGGQGLATIALYSSLANLTREYKLGREARTLNSYMDVILRLLSLPSVFVGFGEGVCLRALWSVSDQRLKGSLPRFLASTPQSVIHAPKHVCRCEQNIGHGISTTECRGTQHGGGWGNSEATVAGVGGEGSTYRRS